MAMIHGFYCRSFLHKPSILGYPRFFEHQCQFYQATTLSEHGPWPQVFQVAEVLSSNSKLLTWPGRQGWSPPRLWGRGNSMIGCDGFEVALIFKHEFGG